MSDEVLATVSASPPRRWLGVGMLAFMGGLLIYVALSTQPAFGWQLFLLGVGIGALLMADRLRRATSMTLELTAQELRTSGGETIVRIDNIKSLDRGMFAFKPSNGFVIRTLQGDSRRWESGLWWRIGRRIGVGGVTPGHQTKNMAEIIAAMIAQRDNG